MASHVTEQEMRFLFSSSCSNLFHGCTDWRSQIAHASNLFLPTAKVHACLHAATCSEAASQMSHVLGSSSACPDLIPLNIFRCQSELGDPFLHGGHVWPVGGREAPSRWVLKVARLSTFTHVHWSAVSVSRSAQGGGDHVTPQPGPAGVWLDLRLCQFAGQHPQDAGGICLLHPLLQ